jgi:hypothetical protein
MLAASQRFLLSACNFSQNSLLDLLQPRFRHAIPL